MTLNSAERKTAAGSEYADPPKNGNNVLLDVTCEGTDGTSDYNLFDWALRDAEGPEYAMAAFAGYEQQLHSGELTAGSKAPGLVVLDAPAGPLTAEYTAGF